jgi:hypothetical protein
MATGVGCATYKHKVAGGPISVVEGGKAKSLQAVWVTMNYVMAGSPVLFLADEIPRTDWQYAKLYNDSPSYRDARGMLSMAYHWTKSVEPEKFRYVIGTTPFIIALGEKAEVHNTFATNRADFVYDGNLNAAITTLVLFSEDQVKENIGRSVPSQPADVIRLPNPTALRTVISERRWDMQYSAPTSLPSPATMRSEQ